MCTKYIINTLFHKYHKIRMSHIQLIDPCSQYLLLSPEDHPANEEYDDEKCGEDEFEVDLPSCIMLGIFAKMADRKHHDVGWRLALQPFVATVLHHVEHREAETNYHH